MKTFKYCCCSCLLLCLIFLLSSAILTSCNGGNAGNVAGNSLQAVDLGLSVKWASCNVGAGAPEEFGEYYAWGEVKTKNEYTEENSLTYRVKFDNIGGDPEYDVARAKLGGSWRMPTEDEFEELIDSCVWKWTAKNGVDGYEITGPNGNSIFLPAAGYRNEEGDAAAGIRGFYSSSTSVKMFHKSLPKLRFDSEHYETGSGPRYYGNTIRPVCD